jgi:hypothetical protein
MSFLDLNLLINQYNNTLSEYISENKNYMELLNSQSQTSQTFETINNTSFIGNNDIPNTQSSTIESCQSLCSNTLGCKGATLDKYNTCYISTSLNTLTKNTDYTTIISQTTNSLLKIVSLNKQLIDLNNSIIQLNVKINVDSPDINKSQSGLVKINDKLISERNKLYQILKENKSINNIYSSTQVELYRTNIHYSLWIFFAFISFIIVIILLIKS